MGACADKCHISGEPVPRKASIVDDDWCPDIGDSMSREYQADGNAGFVRATIIEALCEVLHQSPEWREAGEQLLRTMDKFEFADTWDQIAAGRDKIFPSTASKMKEAA